ncbi:MAG: LysR family transcriptional regulator [Gammaproteobacteria bacterium]|nr:LysR family transcriptional regulator [Gammaproteobacteria bacterium]
MRFNLKQIEAFVWVADLGGFRKAASRLNTTQPNISARISALEAALDVTLMDRDAGSVRLTSKGRELLDSARAILNAADNFVASANQETLLNGVLRLGVTEMVVHTWLRDFLRVLKDRYPKVTVELTVDLSVNLEKELFDRSIDMAFQNGPCRRQVSGNKELGVYSLIWVAAPEMGLQDLPKVTLTELVRHPILTHSRETQSYREVAAHFAQQHHLSSIRLVPSSNLAACIHMTMDGFGVATVPEAMVLKELQSGELVRVNYAWTPMSLNFLARYDAERSPQFVTKSAEIASEVSHDFNSGLRARLAARLSAGM